MTNEIAETGITKLAPIAGWVFGIIIVPFFFIWLGRRYEKRSDFKDAIASALLKLGDAKDTELMSFHANTIEHVRD